MSISIKNPFLENVFSRTNIFHKNIFDFQELNLNRVLRQMFNVNAYYLEKHNKIIIATEKHASSTLSSIMQFESSKFREIIDSKSNCMAQWKKYSSNSIESFNKILWNPKEETFTYPSTHHMDTWNDRARQHREDPLSPKIVDYILQQHRVVSNHISKLIKFKEAGIEIIFLYRNPIQHMYSSIIEDYCKNFGKFDKHNQLQGDDEQRNEFLNMLKTFDIDIGLGRINVNGPIAQNWPDEFIDTLVEVGIKNFLKDHDDVGIVGNIKKLINKRFLDAPIKPEHTNFSRILSPPGHFGHGYYWDFLEEVYNKYKDVDNVKFFNLEKDNIKNIIDGTTRHIKSDKWNMSELNKTPKRFYERFEIVMNRLANEYGMLNFLLAYKLDYPIKVYNKIENNE